MTQYGCIRLVDDLIKYSGILEESAFNNPYSDIFYSDPETGVVNCAEGFDERYERPRSQKVLGVGGRYITAQDIQNFCHIGYMHGMAKTLGWQPHWNGTVCGSIGGYPKGSALRNDSGHKFISRVGNNTEPPPIEPKESAYWKRNVPKKIFWQPSSTTNTPLDVASLDHSIPIEIELPSTEVTWKKRIASFEGQGECRIFTCNGYTLHPSTNYPIFFPLCDYGEMKIRLSKYEDIYTDGELTQDSIEVVSARDVYVKYTTSNGTIDYIPVLVVKPAMAVPLRKGITYHLFLEYYSACPYSRDIPGGPLDFSAGACSLMTLPIHRKLKFPSI